MMRKFVGDKTSIEAHSSDGQRWEGQVFERGQVIKFTDATTAELEQLAAEKRMKPVAGGRA